MKLEAKKIPTIMGLLFLVLSLVMGLFLVNRAQVFLLRASPGISPREVKITNVNDSSFVVSWLSEEETIGFVRLDKGGQEIIFADDRDQLKGQTQKYETHYVTIKDLSPADKYTFKIGSGGKIFDNQGKPYEITTASTIARAAPVADPAYGMVLTTDGQPAEGAIVYLSLANAAPQSAMVRASGNWLITLSSVRTADLTDFVSYDKEASVEELFVQGGKRGTASAVFTTKSDSPAPTLTLGKTYDFRAQEAGGITPSILPSPIPTTAISGEATPRGFSLEPLAPSANTPAVTNVNVVYPGEGEKIPQPRPQALGTGPRKTVLKITLNSQSYFGEVVTDDQGNWAWTPPEDLPPGDHKLTVRYQDAEGKISLIERKFTVLAAEEGELPSFTSTPSATLTPSPVPTVPPRVSQPGTESGVPKPGVLTPTFFLSMMGIVLFIGGFFLRRFSF
ncbi:fibronectin type III domain-containing protein [Candidatus Shapirobacteria bacterium]|nr:fibronectin type III domain-containing protein [Candidatus Shapirobacteria bacterium]